MTRARAEELGAVGLGPARQTRIIKLGALSDHQPRRLKIHPAFRERMLNPLILADQTAEYDALLRIRDRAAQCVLADRDRLGRDQYTFGVQAVEDIAEALAFLTDPTLFGAEQFVELGRASCRERVCQYVYL